MNARPAGSRSRTPFRKSRSSVVISVVYALSGKSRERSRTLAPASLRHSDSRTRRSRSPNVGARRPPADPARSSGSFGDMGRELQQESPVAGDQTTSRANMPSATQSRNHRNSVSPAPPGRARDGPGDGCAEGTALREGLQEVVLGLREIQTPDRVVLRQTAVQASLRPAAGWSWSSVPDRLEVRVHGIAEGEEAEGLDGGEAGLLPGLRRDRPRFRVGGRPHLGRVEHLGDRELEAGQVVAERRALEPRATSPRNRGSGRPGGSGYRSRRDARPRSRARGR